MALVTWIFWLALVGLVYLYAGYPLAVWLLGRGRSLQKVDTTWDGEISVVVVGFNEAARLTAKLDSIFRSEGAERILEVLIGSDGSDDETSVVIERYPDPRVRLMNFAVRRGKPAVLNDVVPQCRGEIVVLTDARQILDEQGIARLVRRFGDPDVGVVSGELMFRTSEDDTAAARGMGAYWAYEKLIRKSESRFRGVPGATGAFYALRRSLFRPIPENTLLDDVVIPMQVVEQGYRCVLEGGAIAWDTPSRSARQESIRKRRTIAGCAQLLVNQPRWLMPWRNPIWWEYVSHKLLRLISPVLLATVLAANIPLASTPLFRGLLVLQSMFYLAAIIAWGLVRLGRRPSLLGTVLMFVSLNMTTVLALWDALRGRYQAAWQRTT